MNSFQIFDGNSNQFDYRQPEQVHHWYMPGTALKLVEYAGQLVRPLPVLASAA